MSEQKKYSYKDLMGMFGSKYNIPPLEDYRTKDEVVYRCPYMSDCPGKYKCVVAVSTKPIEDTLEFNVFCRLCGEKIPIYATHMKWEKKKKVS